MKTEGQGAGWVEQPFITRLLCARRRKIKIKNAQFLALRVIRTTGAKNVRLFLRHQRCGGYTISTIWRHWAVLAPFYRERRDVKTWSCNPPTLSFFLNERKIQGKNSHGNRVPYASLVMLNMFPFIFRKHHGHSFITAIWAPGKIPWVLEILSLSCSQIWLYHFPPKLSARINHIMEGTGPGHVTGNDPLIASLLLQPWDPSFVDGKVVILKTICFRFVSVKEGGWQLG